MTRRELIIGLLSSVALPAIPWPMTLPYTYSMPDPLFRPDMVLDLGGATYDATADDWRSLP